MKVASERVGGNLFTHTASVATSTKSKMKVASGCKPRLLIFGLIIRLIVRCFTSTLQRYGKYFWHFDEMQSSAKFCKVRASERDVSLLTNRSASAAELKGRSH